MQLRYTGPFAVIEIPALGVTVRQGDTFEAPAADGKRLLEQPDNYTEVKSRKG